MTSELKKGDKVRVRRGGALVAPTMTVAEIKPTGFVQCLRPGGSTYMYRADLLVVVEPGPA